MNKSRFYKVGSLLLTLLMISSIVLLTSGCKSTAATKQVDKDSILIGRVNPATGPIAGFGAGTPLIEDAIVKKINDDGGIFIKEYNKKLPIKMVYTDSESDPAKASEAANKLALQNKVDLIVASHTPATVTPVATSAERNKIPTITMDAPVEAWLSGGPYKWAFHSFWTTDAVVTSYLDTMDLQTTNKKIGVAAGNDTDGILFTEAMQKLAPKRGYTVYDPGRFPMNTKDYTKLISDLKNSGCDIVFGNMITPDFTTMIRQFQQQKYMPKMLIMGRALLFSTDIEAMGDLGNGLISELWWSPNHPFKSSVTGQTSADLAKMYSDATGKQYTAPLGYKHATLEVAIDALKRAQTLDRDKLREAIAATNLDTIVGHIKYNDKNYSETPIVTGQWQKGDKWAWEMFVISNKLAPEVPLTTKKMIYPLPGSVK